MIKKIVIGLSVLIGLFAVVVAFQPDTFIVTRSIVMSAPAEVVFAEVNELRRWEAWSPWEKLDPDMTKNYEGPDAGAGATQIWKGNKDVGSGRMTIAESKEPSRILLDLEFYEPMAGTSTTEFTFLREGEDTRMTWTMNGKNDFLGKAVCMFMDMDGMLGGQFEDGLLSLKQVVEAKQAMVPSETESPDTAAAEAAAK